MHNTLLVNKIDMEKSSDVKIEVFFQIGQMDENRDKLMDFFNNSDEKRYARCLYRYNGIILNLKADDIPEVLVDLVQLGVKIYSVFEPYKPI